MRLWPAAAANPTDVAAAGGKPQTVHVRGHQVPVDAANGKYVMRGDLVGDWLYVPRTPPLHSSDTLYVEAGTEVFKGCIDQNDNGKCGPARPPRRVAVDLPVLGLLRPRRQPDQGAVHAPHHRRPRRLRRRARPSRHGGRPVGDEVKTTYRGEIILNAVPSEGPAPASAATTGSTTDLQTIAMPTRRGC